MLSTTCTGPSDYGDSFPLTITFNPGNTSVEVLLSSVSDGIIECEERYIVMLNTTPTISALGVSLGDFPQTEVIIEDNDRRMFFLHLYIYHTQYI